MSIQKVLEEITHWIDIEGVEGVGQGKINDKDCIIVFVSKKTSEIEKKIPSEYKGYPVKIEVSGVLFVQPEK